MRTKTPRSEGEFTAIDLFSGCGGLTLGLKRVGFTVLGAVEIDRLSNKTYLANHKDVPVWETDIRELEPTMIASELNLRRGELDLLSGCPPCQGFSTMRTLNGALACPRTPQNFRQSTSLPPELHLPDRREMAQAFSLFQKPRKYAG
jgi:site-specific DNA-cytosine methylase